MASDWKLVSTTPVASMPAVKYCRNCTPGAISPENTDPKITSMMIGKKKVNTMLVFSRVNWRSSSPVRATPNESADGGAAGRARDDGTADDVVMTAPG